MVAGYLVDDVDGVALEGVAEEIVIVGDMTVNAEHVVAEGVLSDSQVAAVPDFDGLYVVFIEIAFQDSASVGVPDVLTDVATADSVVADDGVAWTEPYAEPISVVLKEVVGDGVSIGHSCDSTSGTILYDIVLDDVSYIRGGMEPVKVYPSLIFVFISEY